MGTRPLADRIAEKRAQKERYDKKAEKCDEELKALLKKEAEETRKQRTHKLIVAGAELAALYGRTLEKDEILALVEFLRQQKNAGIFTLEKTETTVAVANLVNSEMKLGSMGKPVPLYDIHLVDGDGKDVAVGESGEK